MGACVNSVHACYIEIYYMIQLLMVLIIFTDVHSLLEICMNKVFALYMCVVCSWCGKTKSIS